MSEQALDLRRSLQIVRRHKVLVGIMAAVGLLAGAAYTAFHPPQPSSQAMVVLPTSIRDASTQVVIADSDPVLESALPYVGTPLTLQQLRLKVKVANPTPNLITIQAKGNNDKQAENTANAIAQGYVTYLSNPTAPGGQVQARILEHATSATQTPLSLQVAVTEVLGALGGLLIGAIIALVISRGDRRLRERDEVADAIGVPVLASLPVAHPAGAAGWTKLLESYDPGIVDAWRLRNVLQQLGLADPDAGAVRDGGGLSLGIVSLATDAKALALGPQLAVFAASLGIPTVLLIGPQQDPNVSATLRAACAVPAAAPSRRSVRLQVAVSDNPGALRKQDAALTISVAVVDTQNPKVADTLPTNVTVLGVSAGQTTAAQLARVAVSAAAVGRQISGILLADPEPADRTTGRMPQLVRPEHLRQPTRLTSTPTKAKP